MRRMVLAQITAAPALALLLFAWAGCSLRPSYGPDFGDISPSDGENNIATIPTFSWKVEEDVTDVYFHLYPGEAYDLEKNRPTGPTLLLQLSGFKSGRQTVSLQNDRILKSRYSAVGPFVDKGLSTLAYDRDYVWVLMGKKNGKNFRRAFRFHTMAKKKN